MRVRDAKKFRFRTEMKDTRNPHCHTDVKLQAQAAKQFLLPAEMEAIVRRKSAICSRSMGNLGSAKPPKTTTQF